MRQLFTLCLLSSILFTAIAQAQQSEPGMCGTSELMEAYYNANPVLRAERDELEKFTEQFISGRAEAKTTATQYTIPVVFHVYDTVQGGFKINDSLIKTALKWLNEDFHGLNADYNTVHNQFKPIRDTLDITFALARKDPSGNPTSGIIYKPVKAGYANSSSAYTGQIAADAWDNYKYLNIYVMIDLYDNGDLNQSGVGTYPSTTTYNNKTGRIVYNGKYLAYNNTGTKEFASVLTHECGHVLNLLHTFQGGCAAPNDNVADTPPCTTAQGCHAVPSATVPVNCNSSLVNSENYMDYNSGCYKMFTQGQVARMTAALNTAPLISLWQPTNLTDVGLLGVDDIKQNIQVYNLYPNPTNGVLNFRMQAGYTEGCQVTISDITGRVVTTSQHTIHSGDNNIQTDISGQPAGLYLLQVKSESSNMVFKVQLK